MQLRFRVRLKGYLSSPKRFSWLFWMQTPSTIPHSSPKPPWHPSLSMLKFPHQRYTTLMSTGFGQTHLSGSLSPCFFFFFRRCSRGWSNPGESLRASTWMCRWWLQTNSLSAPLWVLQFVIQSSPQARFEPRTYSYCITQVNLIDRCVGFGSFNASCLKQ